MQEKKMLYRKEDRKERKTVESYVCLCSCSVCACGNCNPCDSTPSTAYLTRRDKFNSIIATKKSSTVTSIMASATAVMS